MANKPVDHYTKIAQLTKVLIGTHKCTVDELAHQDAMGVGPRRLRYWLDGDAQMQDFEIQRLLRYLITIGITTVHAAVITPEYALVRRQFGSANGSTKDDFVKAVKAVTGADDAFERQDKQDMRSAIDALRSAVADLEAEYELLP